MLSTKKPKVFNCLVTVLCCKSAIEYCKCIFEKNRIPWYIVMEPPNKYIYDTYELSFSPTCSSELQNTAFLTFLQNGIYAHIRFQQMTEFLLWPIPDKWCQPELQNCAFQNLAGNFLLSKFCFEQSSAAMAPKTLN